MVGVMGALLLGALIGAFGTALGGAFGYLTITRAMRQRSVQTVERAPVPAMDGAKEEALPFPPTAREMWPEWKPTDDERMPPFGGVEREIQKELTGADGD